MKLEPGGRWEWQGVWLPSEDADPDEQQEIVIWSDTIETAAKDALDSLPDGAVVVYLARGRDMTGVTTEIPDDSTGAKILRGEHLN